MRLSKIGDLAPVLAEKLERDGISWRDAPYIHEDVRRMLEDVPYIHEDVRRMLEDVPYIHEDVRKMLESEQFKNGEGCAANWWLRSAASPFGSLRSTETQNTIAQLQAQITARQKENMKMRLTAEMVNAAVFTPRELQTTRLWTMVPDDAENVFYADNVPVAWEGGKVE